MQWAGDRPFCLLPSTFCLFQIPQGDIESDVFIPAESSSSTRDTLLAERIDELTQIFAAQRKRLAIAPPAFLKPGPRCWPAASWATPSPILPNDLGIAYETTKTYSKLARRSLREHETEKN